MILPTTISHPPPHKPPSASSHRHKLKIFGAVSCSLFALFLLLLRFRNCRNTSLPDHRSRGGINGGRKRDNAAWLLISFRLGNWINFLNHLDIGNAIKFCDKCITISFCPSSEIGIVENSEDAQFRLLFWPPCRRKRSAFP